MYISNFQDTVVALQAMSEFPTNYLSGDVLNVTIIGQHFREDLTISNFNRDVMQKFEVIFFLLLKTVYSFLLYSYLVQDIQWIILEQ